MNTFIKAFIYYLLFFLNMYSSYIYLCINSVFNYFINLLTEKNIDFSKILMYYSSCFYLSTFKLLGISIYYRGDEIINDHILWISNHRSKLDGIILQAMTIYKNNFSMGISKYNIKYVPIINPLIRFYRTIFIERNIGHSKGTLIMAAITSKSEKLSIFLFPEGTTMSIDSKKRSDKYAKENGLQVTTNTLIPHITGFELLKNYGDFTSIGNILIRYSNPSIPGYQAHSYIDLFYLFPSEIYIDMKYENFDCNQLYDKFIEKDKILNNNIDKNEYKKFDISINDMIISNILFIIFYSLMFSFPYFAYGTLILIITSYIYEIFSN